MTKNHAELIQAIISAPNEFGIDLDRVAFPVYISPSNVTFDLISVHVALHEVEQLKEQMQGPILKDLKADGWTVIITAELKQDDVRADVFGIKTGDHKDGMLNVMMPHMEGKATAQTHVVWCDGKGYEILLSVLEQNGLKHNETVTSETLQKLQEIQSAMIERMGKPLDG